MNSLIRISCVVNRVQVANPKVCANSMLDAIEQIQNLQPAIVVFPALSLCGASCGFLFHNQTLLDNCMEFLDELCLKTQQMNAYVLAGLPINTAGRTNSVIAVILRGKLLGFLPAGDAPSELSKQYPEKMLCKDSVFACGDLRFSVLSCAPDQLWHHANDPCVQNSDLVIVPSFSPVVAGYTSQVRQMAQAFSQSTGKAIALCNGGLGETSSPRIYKGFAGIYEQGREMAFEACENEPVIATCDLDSDIIHSGQKRICHHALCEPVACLDELGNPKGLYRNILKSPYLENRDISDYLEELFDLQVQSLYNRLENTGIKRVVLGISGGLDSTLALLVAHKAMQRLELDETNIIGITMPGFGTTDRTYYNALKLLEELGVTSMDIPIRASVMQHFADIGQDPNCHDTTYENAQARERTQILLDIANKANGLVVGTGDLSEEALGFCTFAGDHIANYNVNVCIPKSLMRFIVRFVADMSQSEAVHDTLYDILDTPVSPELLPSEDANAPAQKTESILGPYELHDFFAYYFLKYRMRPSKIFHYACIAFSGELNPAFILEKLKLFIRRFFAAQFKRACAPDSAVITDFALSDYAMPSDLNPQILLEELENIKVQSIN